MKQVYSKKNNTKQEKNIKETVENKDIKTATPDINGVYNISNIEKYFAAIPINRNEKPKIINGICEKCGVKAYYCPHYRELVELDGREKNTPIMKVKEYVSIDGSDWEPIYE